MGLEDAAADIVSVCSCRPDSVMRKMAGISLRSTSIESCFQRLRLEKAWDTKCGTYLVSLFVRVWKLQSDGLLGAKGVSIRFEGGLERPAEGADH